MFIVKINSHKEQRRIPRKTSRTSDFTMEGFFFNCVDTSDETPLGNLILETVKKMLFSSTC